MGPGRRMKKQGPPASLEELGINLKRKSTDNTAQSNRSRKRRKSAEQNEVVQPTKLVKLDRALREERAEKINVKEARKSKKSQRLVNPDAQITVPPPASMLQDDLEEGEEDLEEDAVEENLDDVDLDDDEVDEMALDDLEDQDDSVSVVDSDEDEQQPRGMFSEDEDESDAEAQLTAANIEGLSRKLDQEQADVAAEAQQELEDTALQTNIAKDDGILASAAATQGIAPDLQLIRTRMIETIRVLGSFSKLAEEGKSRADYTTQLLEDICTYYGYTPYLAEKLFSLFPPAEAFAFFEANETPRPVVLRTNTLRTNRRTLAQSLINRGVVLEPVGKWSKVGLQVFEAPVPLGATPEYLAGHYILQAASSFLPVMALAPQPNERILDMAAAPGGKTTYISALMRNTGCVFANDANRQRAKGLIGNVHRLGCKNVIVCHYEAEKAFPKILGGFDRILLDAPCSGTGVIGKDPSVKTSKNERDFLALPHMQKQLLLAAIDSVDHNSKTGGYIVYSTCSVSMEENEGVVQYVLRKRPNVRIVDTGLGGFGSEGFKAYMGKKFDDRMNLTRRYFPHRENVDGFFVCKLKKTGPLTAATVKATGTVTQTNGVNGKSSSAISTEDADDDGDVTSASEKDGKKSRVNGTGVVQDGETEETAVGNDDFGGFDEAQDDEIIARAEKKWLKARGIDPKAAAGKKDKTAREEAAKLASAATDENGTSKVGEEKVLSKKEQRQEKKSKSSSSSSSKAAEKSKGSKEGTSKVTMAPKKKTKKA